MVLKMPTLHKLSDQSKKYFFILLGALLDLFHIVLIVLFLKFILNIIGDSPYGIDTKELFRIYWMSAPLVILYLLLRICNFGYYLSLCITLLFSYVLAAINSKKIALTDQPLSFNDIIAGVNIPLVIKYVSVYYFFVVGCVFVLAIIIFLVEKYKIKYKGNKVILFLIFFLTLPMAFSPYLTTLESVPGWVKENIQSLNNKYDMNYFSWDWPGNVIKHGLPIHIVQTSMRLSAPSMKKEDVEKYLSMKKEITTHQPNAKTIIFILCESCWYDNRVFKEIYNPLFDEGFVELRATSPHYGAGTANIEFEMLTGLPSNSKYLSGIIYQEYVDIFKNNVETTAQVLKREGYYTYAAHNNSRSFWRRGDVYSKFGFDEFVDLTQMGDTPYEITKEKKPWQWQSDDYLLYRSALKALKEHKGRPVFMNLVTMATHGPYPHINDSGESAYKYEMAEAISRLREFSQQVELIDKDAIIIVYGDHKPALNKFFYDNNVMPHDLFSSIGSKDEDFSFKLNVTPLEYGDVPVLIKYSNKQAVEAFKANANGKPYFCIASLIDNYFIRSGSFVLNYMQQNGCMKPLYVDYNGYVDLIGKASPWLYSVTLFQNIDE